MGKRRPRQSGRNVGSIVAHISFVSKSVWGWGVELVTTTSLRGHKVVHMYRSLSRTRSGHCAVTYQFANLSPADISRMAYHTTWGVLVSKRLPMRSYATRASSLSLTSRCRDHLLRPSTTGLHRVCCGALLVYIIGPSPEMVRLPDDDILTLINGTHALSRDGATTV